MFSTLAGPIPIPIPAFYREYGGEGVGGHRCDDGGSMRHGSGMYEKKIV